MINVRIKSTFNHGKILLWWRDITKKYISQNIYKHSLGTRLFCSLCSTQLTLLQYICSKCYRPFYGSFGTNCKFSNCQYPTVCLTYGVGSANIQPCTWLVGLAGWLSSCINGQISRECICLFLAIVSIQPQTKYSTLRGWLVEFGSTLDTISLKSVAKHCAFCLYSPTHYYLFWFRSLHKYSSLSFWEHTHKGYHDLPNYKQRQIN